jgi:hypothetical protein
MLISSVYVSVHHLLGIALVLAEVLPHVGLGLLGMKVLIGVAAIDGPQFLIVFRLGVVLLILEANPLGSRMM